MTLHSASAADATPVPDSRQSATRDQNIYDFVDASSDKQQIVLKKQALPPQGSPAVLPYRSPKDERATLTDTEQIKNVRLPLALLGGGIFIELLAALIWRGRIGPALVSMMLDLTVGTGMMLGALWVAAKVRGIDLGKPGVAAYKLAAVSIAPAAAMEFITPLLRFIPMGWILSSIIEFVLFFALLGALFDLDESDTWYCVCIMFVTRVAVYVALIGLFR